MCPFWAPARSFSLRRCTGKPSPMRDRHASWPTACAAIQTVQMRHLLCLRSHTSAGDLSRKRRVWRHATTSWREDPRPSTWPTPGARGAGDARLGPIAPLPPFPDDLNPSCPHHGASDTSCCRSVGSRGRSDGAVQERGSASAGPPRWQPPHGARASAHASSDLLGSILISPRRRSLGSWRRAARRCSRPCRRRPPPPSQLPPSCPFCPSCRPPFCYRSPPP